MPTTNLKKRFPLPEDYQKIYAEWIRLNRTGATRVISLANYLESWMHKKVAKDVQNPSASALRTLEIGAGTLNHLKYESNSNHYDVVEPSQELLKISNQRSRINMIYNSIYDIPDAQKYERIISVAVLEHLEDLPQVLSKASELMAKGATFRAGIPNEGNWLWELGWRLTTAREFKKKYNLDYSVMMKYEHINTAAEIIKECEKVFRKVKVKCFGLNKNCAFYLYIECEN